MVILSWAIKVIEACDIGSGFTGLSLDASITDFVVVLPKTR